MNVKKLRIGALIVLVVAIVIQSLAYLKKNDGEQLARQHCGACHTFPEPSLLDKDNWTKSVIPRMAFRMGVPTKITYELQDLKMIESMVPKVPSITQEELALIKAYYQREAPQSLASQPSRINKPIEQFNVEKVKHFEKRRITLLKYDANKKRFYVGDVLSWLYTLDEHLNVIDSVQLQSPATWLITVDSGLLVTQLGDLRSSDQPNGQLVHINPAKKVKIVIDSLKRPDYFTYSDINGDATDDLILCSFGNFTGALEIYKNGIINKKNKIALLTSPGVRKVETLDWDKDGDKDIVTLAAQGDERIILYKNKGNYVFDMQVLQQFPPVFGSCYFEVVDVNNDGLEDIIYTNGDNADYTKIIKPYHGVKIFEHQRSHTIKEVWSYAMPGAYQTCTDDFDGDGDLDIAAISLFPDPEQPSEQSFVYFNNQGNNSFVPQTTQATENGKWMVMECFDADNDGDKDLMIAPFSFENLGARTESRTPGMLLLKNKKLSTPIL